MLPLDCLQRGECGEITEVSGEPNWVCRLAELGLRVGCRLRMLQPGSPCLVLIDGGRLSLRSEGCLILVRPVS